LNGQRIKNTVSSLKELSKIRTNRCVLHQKECSERKSLEVVIMAYGEKVLDHYENPRNVGSFENDDNVGTGMVGAPACGDVMKLQIKVNGDGIIEDAVFKTYGCGSAIASSSLLTEWVKGKTLEEAKAIKNTQIAEELALPPVKIHCSVLAEDAINAAISDYRQKNH
jgi:nitrogen fixation NifU-like protein